MYTVPGLVPDSCRVNSKTLYTIAQIVIMLISDLFSCNIWHLFWTFKHCWMPLNLQILYPPVKLLTTVELLTTVKLLTTVELKYSQTSIKRSPLGYKKVAS